MKRVKGTPYWEVTAIPITPYNDDLSFDPLQVARVTVRNARTNKVLAVQPKVVVPVSDEMRCDLCHGPVDTAGSILQAHDAANATHPVRRPAGRRPPRLQRVPQGQRPGRARACPA